MRPVQNHIVYSSNELKIDQELASEGLRDNCIKSRLSELMNLRCAAYIDLTSVIECLMVGLSTPKD